MSIKSTYSDKVTNQDKTGRRLLQEKEDQDKKLKFSARVVSHTSKEIEFQLEFENAYLVSETSKYDKIKIRINKANLFRSRETYKTTSEGCEEQKCFIDFEQIIPPQMQN